MKDRPPDYVTVVKTHAERTTGFVLADSGDGLDIQDAEVRRVRRTLQPLGSGDLAALRLPRSWILAVVLCPDDSMKGVAEWAATLAAAQRERIRMFHHPGCDLVTLLAPWYDAGLDDPRVDEVRDFASLHRLFGNDLNDQIYADAMAGLS